MAVTPLFLVCLSKAPSLSEVAPTFLPTRRWQLSTAAALPQCHPSKKKRGANGESGSFTLRNLVSWWSSSFQGVRFDFAHDFSFRRDIVADVAASKGPSTFVQYFLRFTFYFFPWTSCPTDRSFRFSSLSLPGAPASPASKVPLGLISAVLIRSKQPEVGFLALRKIQ